MPSNAFEFRVAPFSVDAGETFEVGYRVTIVDGVLAVGDMEHLRSVR